MDIQILIVLENVFYICQAIKIGTSINSDSYISTPLDLTSFYFCRPHKTPLDFTEPYKLFFKACAN